MTQRRDDRLLSGECVAEGGNFSANQQAGKKFANLLARQRAQHVRSANFKQLRQDGGLLIPRCRPAANAAADVSCGGKPAPTSEC